MDGSLKIVSLSLIFPDHAKWKNRPICEPFLLFIFYFIQIMKALLEKHTRSTFHDETQQTPLHLAAQHGMYEQVEALARRVACGLNERDEQGQTPLHNAVMNGNR